MITLPEPEVGDVLLEWRGRRHESYLCTAIDVPAMSFTKTSVTCVWVSNTFPNPVVYEASPWSCWTITHTTSMYKVIRRGRVIFSRGEGADVG